MMVFPARKPKGGNRPRGFIPHPAPYDGAGGISPCKKRSESRSARTARSRGFTMVEALIVVGLFSIIGVSLYQSFAMGLKVWRRATRPNVTYRKAVVNLERLARELRHSRAYPNTSFQGGNSAFTFCSVTNGKVINLTYEYKQSGLWRGTLQLGAGWDPGTQREVIPNVEAVDFTYYGYDSISQTYAFFNEWNGTGRGVPSAIRVMMDLVNETHIEKTMRLPIAS